MNCPLRMWLLYLDCHFHWVLAKGESDRLSCNSKVEYAYMFVLRQGGLFEVMPGRVVSTYTAVITIAENECSIAVQSHAV